MLMCLCVRLPCDVCLSWQDEASLGGGGVQTLSIPSLSRSQTVAHPTLKLLGWNGEKCNKNWVIKKKKMDERVASTYSCQTRPKDPKRVFKKLQEKAPHQTSISSCLFLVFTYVWVPLRQLFLLLQALQSIGPFHTSWLWMNESTKEAAAARTKLDHFPKPCMQRGFTFALGFHLIPYWFMEKVVLA